MTVFLFILCFLFFIALAVSHFFIRDKKWAKINRNVTLVCGIAGALSSVVTFIVFYILSSKYETNDSEWARATIWSYLKDALPILGIILAILILSAVFQPKMKVMRVIVIALASMFILVFGLIASYISENGSVSVDIYIYIFSISLAVMTQFCGYFDFRRLYEKLCGAKEKKTPKKRK